jgi:hypothetical protein
VDVSNSFQFIRSKAYLPAHCKSDGCGMRFKIITIKQ